MLRRHPRLMGVLLGLTVMSASLSFLFISEIGKRLEFLTYDTRILHCNQLMPTTPIVHVDIDNNSLERVRRWPWHRNEIADVVRVMHELGASTIMIDLLLTEPEAPYFHDPRLSKYGDDITGEATLGEFSEENYIYPDLELAEAIREAGNVILAMELDLPARVAPDPRVPLRQSVVEKLLTDFTLTSDQLAAELTTTPAAIETVIASAKSKAALASVEKLSLGGRTVNIEEAFQKILKDRKDVMNADRIDIEKAVFTAKGLRASRKLWQGDIQHISGNLRSANEATPPCHVLADAAADVAVVNFIPDQLDGSVRTVPLLVKQGGKLAMQMGLAGACRILHLKPDTMRLTATNILTIASNDGNLINIPLDVKGSMLIHWTATAKQWREDQDFRHIAAAKLYSLADTRRQIQKNLTLKNYKLADVVAIAKGEVKASAGTNGPVTVAADNAFRKKINDELALKQRLHMSKLRGDVPAEKIAKMEKQDQELLANIAKDQRQAISAVKLAWQELSELPAEELAKDPAVTEDKKKFRKAMDVIEKEIPAIDATNARMESEAAAIAIELKREISGKNIFLGFAATAEGDIVPTPIDPSTNGVMCHANVLNGILQNRFIAPASRVTEVLVALLIGTAVTFVTATRSPKVAFLITLGLMAAYALINAYVVFMRLGIWFAMSAPLITIFVTWAFVTLLRQLTAERERRLFAKQLSQYTSPIIAARIAENPEAVAAFKTVQSREMSFFFSDLAGFTTLAEQENPEVVQHVLNAYLERMSRVIWSHRGLINKFMGDGIMAFFNPSVDPLPNHARIACETGLAVINELEKLKVEFAGDPAAHIFKKLSMRLGLSTGQCKNGDLGSELKADYTVIGDVVNLAARLEPANKVFGTFIMVSGALRDAAKDEFEFRYLAELQVKGKASTAPVYELICHKGKLTEEQRQYNERFEAGVELYKNRKWDECIVHFTRLLSRRFDDVGASRYVDACQEFKRFPPDDNWTGALELKEK